MSHEMKCKQNVGPSNSPQGKIVSTHDMSVTRNGNASEIQVPWPLLEVH